MENINDKFEKIANRQKLERLSLSELIKLHEYCSEKDEERIEEEIFERTGIKEYESGKSIVRRFYETTTVVVIIAILLYLLLH